MFKLLAGSKDNIEVIIFEGFIEKAGDKRY
jgi:hypothetical protein